jgi:Ca-activated chloride channel family protein
MKRHLSATRISGIRLLAPCFCALISFSLALSQSVGADHIPSTSNPATLQAVTSTALASAPRVDVAASEPLRVTVDVVQVPVTVSDRHNRPVTALGRKDFSVYEDDKRQEIQYFSTEESPLSIAILFDVSKSMSDKIDSERDALVDFFNNANPDDEYFAITFSDRPRMLATSTQSIDELQYKLLAIEPGGPTALLDAVYLAESKLRCAHHERKAIVIFSDGGDNASRYKLREIKSLVQESDVEVYAIGLFDKFFVGPVEEKLGKEWLGEITDASGGRTITVDNRAKLPEAAAVISREIRHQYVLGYRPSARTKGTWRKIKVNVTDPLTQQRLYAHYRKGYLGSAKTSAQN